MLQSTAIQDPSLYFVPFLTTSVPLRNGCRRGSLQNDRSTPLTPVVRRRWTKEEVPDGADASRWNEFEDRQGPVRCRTLNSLHPYIFMSVKSDCVLLLPVVRDVSRNGPTYSETPRILPHRGGDGLGRRRGKRKCPRLKISWRIWGVG